MKISLSSCRNKMLMLRTGGLAVILAAAACSSDTGDTPPAKPTNPAGDYSIKIYIQHDGARTRFDFGPLPTFVDAEAAAQSGTTHPSSTHVLASPAPPPGSITVVGGSSWVPLTPDAQSLIGAAAAQCGMVGVTDTAALSIQLGSDSRYTELQQQIANKQSILQYAAVTPAWSTSVNGPSPWYVFPKHPTTCDQVLEYEETLLCVADKLAQLADAIAPVEWGNIRWLNGGNPPPDLSWVIPPQSDQDKFIARDTAIQVLAHIPWLDSLPFEQQPAVGHTCSALYGAYDAVPTSTQSQLDPILWGGLPQDASYPLAPDTGSGRTLARERLAFETNTLRAAGQLLHDLLREGVYSDLAGAAKRSANAADPKGGQQTAWGWDGKSPFNSLAHTVRLLAGRWEMGNGEPDPVCLGTTEADLIKLADPGTRGRANDMQPGTASQATASNLFEVSGIVVADNPMNSTLDLRGVLQDRLMIVNGTNHGMTAVQYAATTSGQALTNVIASLSDADLARGAQRTRSTFGLLTSGATSDAALLPGSASRIGLATTPISGGVAVGGGLGRGLVVTDVTARSGPMLIASQCYEQRGGTPALMMDETAVGVLTAAIPNVPELVGARVMRQDAFAIGHALRARLVKLREAADPGSPPVGVGTPPDVRARATSVAEIGAWAGTGRAVISTDLGDKISIGNPSPNQVFVDLVGVDPAAFAVKTAAEISPDMVSLVFADASLAECAAHLSATVCDPVALGNATWKPAATAVTIENADAGWRSARGVTHSVVRLTFNVDNSAPLALRSGTAFANAVGTAPFYIVQTQDPARSTGIGAIAGAIRLPATIAGGFGFILTTFGAGATTLSPMRRELLDAAIGVGKWVGAAPPRAGENTFASSPNYCVEGVARDVFVPLENDLTSDSDAYENSWRHYVNLARDAAKRADDIGQTWVEIGFQRDTTAESAGEQLQQVDGDPVNIDDITVDQQGNIQAGTSNGALNAVLNQPTIDLVFFTTDPIADEPNKLTAMKTILGCGHGTDQPLCARTAVKRISPNELANFQNPGADTITYLALGLADAPTDMPPSAIGACKPLVDSALGMKGVTPTLTSGGTFQSSVFQSAFGNDPNRWSADPDALVGAVQVLRMKVATDASWRVEAGAAPMMNSADPSLWPGCLRTAGGCQTNPLGDSLNRIFRYCPDSSRMNSALGDPGCEGAGDDLAELNGLRWRVEGVLWLTAQMAGGIPQGMFTTPMPAVNFGGQDAAHTARTHTVYGNGLIADVGGVLQLVQGSGRALPDGDQGRLTESGPVANIDAAFNHWATRAAEMVPAWLRGIYSSPPTDGNTYYHVMGANPSGPADHSTTARFFSDALGVSGDPARVGATQWRAIAPYLDKPSCLSPSRGDFGDTRNGKLQTGWLQGLIATMKTRHRAGSALVSTISNPAFGLYGTTFAWDFAAGNRFRFDPPRNVEFSGGPVAWYDQNFWFGMSPVWYSAVLPVWYDSWTGAIGSDEFSQNTRSPGAVRPSDRVRHAVNSGTPNGDCGAAWELTQAVALSCIVSSDGIVASLGLPTDPPRDLASEADLVTLEAWMRGTVRIARKSFRNGFVASIPTAALQSVFTQQSPGGAQGDYGQKIQQMVSAILDVAKNWNLVTQDADKIVRAIAVTRNSIDQVNTTTDLARIGQLIQKLQTEKDIAQNVAHGISSIASAFGDGAKLNPFAAGAEAAGSAAAIVFDGLIISAIDDLEGKTTELQREQIRGAVLQLQSITSQSATDLSNSLISIRQDLANIRGVQLGLASDRSRAAYFAGKAAGLGVWNCGGADAPRQCTSHVNTVLNRRYAGFEIRYKRALRDAKALAYMARRAVEQRIGLRLSDITTRVGPLEAPSTWADDVCRLTGVDYRRLRQEPGLDAGTKNQRDAINAALAAEFADGFIGDYVEKLANFVEFYNVAFPQKDADDTAVLSLRENILRSTTACTVRSRNLLVDSSRLYALSAPNAQQSVRGWQRHACAAGTATCVQARSVGIVSLPPEASTGGAAWLADQTRPALQNGVDPVNIGTIDGPDGFISQAAHLEPGRYVLTWWDGARDVSGAMTTSAADYRVVVYDASWNPVTTWTGTPASSMGGAWSNRRNVQVAIGAPGTYHVAFAASLRGAGTGSVAIANVQLEALTQGGTPTAYVDNDSRGLVTSFQCNASAGDLRDAFTRRCSAMICYYELTAPVVIDTAKLEVSGVSLVGKLASGNFNYRHIDVALNLVGTGVRDCTGSNSPDCYGSGYIEYTLDHNADNVGVLGFDGQSRAFDFGIGSINHGKALTAERYITTPIGSADQQLLSQPEIMKPELRGRPLDGIYRLRIHDTPALHWDRLDDIQIVLKSHYWSRVATPGR